MLDDLIKDIKEHLTPDLLKPRYREENKAGNPMYGHCYIATEALYYLIRSEKYDLYDEYSGFKPRCGKEPNGDTHWWLQTRDGDIIDPTKEQFDILKRPAPYYNSRFTAFMYTGEADKPSNRTKELIGRIMK